MFSKEQRDQQLQVLNLEHNQIIDTLNELINVLEEQYEMAAQSLTCTQEYGPKYTVNLGLIHSLINNVEATAKLVDILRNNPIDSEKNRLSIYLMREEIPLSPAKPTMRENIENIEEFIQKHAFSTEISLPKSLIQESILQKIDEKCKNIFTMTLESDQLDQKNQIQDSDLVHMKIFQNISVLQLKQSAITDSSIEFIKGKMPNIKQIDLTGCYMLTDRGIKLLSQCNLVTIIMNSMSSLRQNTVTNLIRASPNLNYLQIKQCPHISETFFLKIYEVYKIHQSTLKWLELISDHGVDLYINKLTYLTSSNPIEEITDNELKTLIGEEPNYSGLFFENCQQLTKQSLQLIINKCRGLKRLALSKFINLTDRLVQDLSLSLSQLVFLDLNSCFNITNNALYYIANNLDIQYLILQKCLSITDEGLSNIIKYSAQSPSITPPRKKSISMPKKERSYLRIPSNRSQRPNIQLKSFNTPTVNHMEQQSDSDKGIKLKYLNIAHCNKITDQSLSLLCQMAYELEYLNLSNCDQITDVSIENISQELRHLEYLNLNHCEGLTDSSISFLATRLGQNLKVLELQWCQISQNCVRLILENLTNLRVLNLSYCPAVISDQIELIAKNMPKIHTLKLQSCSKIKQYAFIKLASLKELKILCIKQCVEATDTFVKLLTTNNKYLEHLDISWCTQITDKGLFSIAKNCYNLKYLNLNGCVEITDEGIQWLSATVSQIQYLNLTLCSRLTDLAVMEITEKMRSLKNLYLCELELLTDISIATISNLDKLEQLMLMGCTGITNSSLIGLMYNLAKLNELNISQCRSVDGKYLKKICQFMHNIKVLEVSEIQIDDLFLDELAVHCPKLTYINLCYCNQISDEAVLKMLQRMPRLEKIDIQNTNIAQKTKSVLVHALNARRMANIVLK